MDIQDINKTLEGISYGLYVVGASEENRPAGCIINAVMQITAENPVIAISLNKNNHTYEVIKNTKRFSLSILSEKTDPKIIGKLGFVSGRDTDKFSDVNHKMRQGLPVITDHSCGCLFCELLSVFDVETHATLFGRVVSAELGEAAPPMTYKYYHETIKGKAHKNAPTFYQNKLMKQKEEDDKMEEKVSYVCEVCGYVYEGDINNEPDDYVCPICGVGKDQFEKQ